VAAARNLHAQPRWRSDPFALGVTSGAPAPDSVVLWTRLLPRGGLPDGGHSPVPVRWEVAHDEGFTRIAQRGEALALPELGHSVHVEVPGLEPDRWYFYRFTSGDAASATGRTRTLPAPDARPALLRVAYASCQRWEHGHYAAWRHMRAEALDFVLFLGDYIYEYPNATAAVRSFPTLAWVKTLPEYRERYALHRSEPSLQAMHAACPWLVTWDDHEVQNDYAGVHAGDPRPMGMNAVADFAARRAAAYQAFYEHMPLRAADFARALVGRGPAGELRLHTRYRFGRLADLLLLDDRQYRDPQVCAPPGQTAGPIDPAACAAWADPARTLLGAAQERWLDQALAEAPQAWTVHRPADAVRPARPAARRRPAVLQRRLGRLPGRAATRAREPAAAPRGQPGAARWRRARELGRPRARRLRTARQRGAGGGVLRHQHHVASGQRRSPAGPAGREPALHLCRRGASRVRRGRIHAGAPDDHAARAGRRQAPGRQPCRPWPASRSKPAAGGWSGHEAQLVAPAAGAGRGLAVPGRHRRGRHRAGLHAVAKFCRAGGPGGAR
jgi:hypothetical protein